MKFSDDAERFMRVGGDRLVALGGILSSSGLRYSVVKIGLDPDRMELTRRLDARVEEMFRRGLLDEIRGLLASGLTGKEKPFESLGYKQALAHLNGSMTLDEAVASTQLQTRQYAKRQRTWFRRDAGICWFSGFGDSAEVFAEALALLGKPIVK